MNGHDLHSQSHVQLEIPIVQNIETSASKCGQKFFCFQRIFQFVTITKKPGIRDNMSYVIFVLTGANG